MANELGIAIKFTGITAYARIRNRVNQIWNTAGTPAFEAFNASNITDYDIAGTEQSTSKFYIASFPTAIATGYYTAIWYLQGGASPALGDVCLGQESGYWEGSGGAWLPVTAERGTDGANTATPPTAVQNRQEMDSNSTQLAKLGTPAVSVSADIAAVKVDTAAILDDTGTAGVVLTSGERTAIGTALLALASETGLTVGELFKIAFAALAGKTDTFEGADAATNAHFRDKADSKNRITVTTDADGNRTSITFDLT